MADLKTTAEERARLLERASPLARARPWSATLALVCDVDTLLAENARLRAVAEAARVWTMTKAMTEAEAEALHALTQALTALEAP